MEKLYAITIKDNEHFLRKKSEEVDFKKDNIKQYIDKLDEYFETSELTLAMAAVQLGIPKRIIYLKNTDINIIERKQQGEETESDLNHNERRILINPKIIYKKGLTEYWEACASCLDYVGKVKRPYSIELTYYDINGKENKELFTGFEATVLSHELDHLDGILHIDIAEEVLEMNKEERKEFRKTHGYIIINTEEDYEKLKQGE